jgi:hypothetical protein
MRSAEIGATSLVRRALEGLDLRDQDIPLRLNSDDIKGVFVVRSNYELQSASFQEADALATLSTYRHLIINPSSTDASGEIITKNSNYDTKIISAFYTIVYDLAATVTAEIAANARIQPSWIIVPVAYDVTPFANPPNPYIIPPTALSALQSGLLRYNLSPFQHPPSYSSSGQATFNAWDGIVPANCQFGLDLFYMNSSFAARAFPANTDLEFQLVCLRVPRGQGFPF